MQTAVRCVFGSEQAAEIIRDKKVQRPNHVVELENPAFLMVLPRKNTYLNGRKAAERVTK